MSRKELRQRLRDQGKCSECYQPTDISPCLRCKEANRRRMAKFNKGVLSGVCVKCSDNSVEGRSLCETCAQGRRHDRERARIQNQKTAKAKKDQRRAAGKCLECDELKLPDKAMCRKHYDYRVARHRDKKTRGECSWCESPVVAGTSQCRFHTDKLAAYARGVGRYNNSVSKAKQRGMEWSISREDYENMMRQSCNYCGFHLSPAGIGLDRQDNNSGYTFDNTVPCCDVCNIARSDHFSPEEMEKHIGPAIRKIKFERGETPAQLSYEEEVEEWRAEENDLMVRGLYFDGNEQEISQYEAEHGVPDFVLEEAERWRSLTPEQRSLEL